MILIADGGSTKVDWRLLEKGNQISQFHTAGINPYFHSVEEIKRLLNESFVPMLGDRLPEAIYFYGAGCANSGVNKTLFQGLSETLGCAEIQIYSDLLGAARGLCGEEKGIACILGTGSNSCYYDGKEIQENVSPLGYILGDEGSGAVLGRLFIGACLKNRLTVGIKEIFLETYQLTPALILEKVYRQPTPNRFLAGISPFILRHIQDESVRTLVKNSFCDFFLNNVMQYDYKSHPVYFTGSVAYHYQDILQEVAGSLDIRIHQILSSPMEGLIAFHS